MGSHKDLSYHLLYINDFLECLQNTTSGMYADDTRVYASFASLGELVLKLNQDLENIVKWLSQIKLKLHSEKNKSNVHRITLTSAIKLAMNK